MQPNKRSLSEMLAEMPVDDDDMAFGQAAQRRATEEIRASLVGNALPPSDAFGLREGQTSIESAEIRKLNRDKGPLRADGYQWDIHDQLSGRRDGQTYNESWMSEMLVRRRLIDADPDRRFVELFAKMTNQAPDEMYDKEIGRIAVERELARQAQRALDTKRKTVPVDQKQKQLEAITQQRMRVHAKLAALAEAVGILPAHFNAPLQSRLLSPVHDDALFSLTALRRSSIAMRKLVQLAGMYATQTPVVFSDDQRREVAAFAKSMWHAATKNTEYSSPAAATDDRKLTNEQRQKMAPFLTALNELGARTKNDDDTRLIEIVVAGVGTLVLSGSLEQTDRIVDSNNLLVTNVFRAALHQVFEGFQVYPAALQQEPALALLHGLPSADSDNVIDIHTPVKGSAVSALFTIIDYTSAPHLMESIISISKAFGYGRANVLTDSPMAMAAPSSLVHPTGLACMSIDEKLAKEHVSFFAKLDAGNKSLDTVAKCTRPALTLFWAEVFQTEVLRKSLARLSANLLTNMDIPFTDETPWVSPDLMTSVLELSKALSSGVLVRCVEYLIARAPDDVTRGAMRALIPRAPVADTPPFLSNSISLDSAVGMAWMTGYRHLHESAVAGLDQLRTLLAKNYGISLENVKADVMTGMPELMWFHASVEQKKRDDAERERLAAELVSIDNAERDLRRILNEFAAEHQTTFEDTDSRRSYAHSFSWAQVPAVGGLTLISRSVVASITSAYADLATHVPYLAPLPLDVLTRDFQSNLAQSFCEFASVRHMYEELAHPTRYNVTRLHAVYKERLFKIAKVLQSFTWNRAGSLYQIRRNGTLLSTVTANGEVVRANTPGAIATNFF